jgi:hypothetical protein
MDEVLMWDWIHVVWDLLRKQAILITDSFRGHLDPVKEHLCRSNTDLAIIPGGFTSVLQLLDMSINESFKDNLHCTYLEGWHELMPDRKGKWSSLKSKHLWLVRG